jgi:hypothetical protein
MAFSCAMLWYIDDFNGTLLNFTSNINLQFSYQNHPLLEDFTMKMDRGAGLNYSTVFVMDFGGVL